MKFLAFFVALIVPSTYAQVADVLCDTCEATINSHHVSSCGDALRLVKDMTATCSQIMSSNCSCCGFCDSTQSGLQTQYAAYHQCPTPDGITPCNFCKGSTYSQRDVIQEGCIEAAINTDGAIALGFFFGAYGTNYWIYGYNVLGTVMAIISGIATVFIIVGRFCFEPLAKIGGVMLGGMGCWGFVVFIMTAVYDLMPVANEYDIYCPISCRSIDYTPTISEVGTNVYAPTENILRYLR